MTRLTLCLVSIACLVAQALPTYTVELLTVTKEVRPKMFIACAQVDVVEHQRICRQRVKSAQIARKP